MANEINNTNPVQINYSNGSNNLSDSTPGAPNIWWDNAKTTGYFGGLASGYLFGGIGAICALPTYMPEGGFALGFIAGVATFAPISALTCSIPFTLSARYTRKFRKNKDIDLIVESILKIDDNESKQVFIDTIIQKNDECSTFSIQSYESFQLVKNLREDDKNLAEKWTTLTAYLTDNTDGKYSHNGKKTFNVILDILPNQLKDNIQKNNAHVVTQLINKFPNLVHHVASDGKSPIDWAKECNQPQADVVELLKKNGALDHATERRKELKKLMLIIDHSGWQQEGWGILKNYTPPSIERLRTYLKTNNLNPDELETRTDAEIFKISQALKEMVENVGFSITRGNNIKILHRLLANLGHNSDDDFNKLEAFYPPANNELCPVYVHKHW